MQRLFFLIAALIAVSSLAFSEYSFTIHPQRHTLSRSYDICSGKVHYHSIENHYFQLHTVYSLFSGEEEIATGTARLFSLGALFDSMREIDITDGQGEYLGSIQGNWGTQFAAKFTFIDEVLFPYATAYVALDHSRVYLVDAYDEQMPIATFKRRYAPGRGGYYWEVKVVDEAAIDSRVVEIFAAFITDALWPTVDEQWHFLLKEDAKRRVLSESERLIWDAIVDDAD